jgi:hypothetical protein
MPLSTRSPTAGVQRAQTGPAHRHAHLHGQPRPGQLSGMLRRPPSSGCDGQDSAVQNMARHTGDRPALTGARRQRWSRPLCPLHGAARWLVSCPEDACGEPDDAGVDGDLDGGVAGAVVLPVWADAERAGQGLLPGAGGRADASAAAGPGSRCRRAGRGGWGRWRRGPCPPSAPDGAAGRGGGGSAGRGNLGEGADVELHGVAAGREADPEPLTIEIDHKVPQLTGSTPPNASRAMAIPQDLWHRTIGLESGPLERLHLPT